MAPLHCTVWPLLRNYGPTLTANNCCTRKVCTYLCTERFEPVIVEVEAEGGPVGAGPVRAGPVRLPVQTHGGARGCSREPATVTRRFYKKPIRSNYQPLKMINDYLKGSTSGCIHTYGLSLKLCSDREKANAKIFFDVCSLFFDLFYLFFDRCRFCSSFRLVWIGSYRFKWLNVSLLCCSHMMFNYI